jgi:REP element-mobilizing transposase RayT
MRSRYRIHDSHAAYFVTGTIVAWLAVFTTATRCCIVTESLEWCRRNKGLEIYSWVILDNHFHALLAAPDLARVLADFKRHTARQIIEQLKLEDCKWLLNQLEYFCAAHKAESRLQVWQEGSHPQEIVSDEMMGQKIDYIHANPVRRGLVTASEHWRFSSAHEWCLGGIPALRCDLWR